MKFAQGLTSPRMALPNGKLCDMITGELAGGHLSGARADNPLLNPLKLVRSFSSSFSRSSFSLSSFLSAFFLLLLLLLFLFSLLILLSWLHPQKDCQEIQNGPFYTR